MSATLVVWGDDLLVADGLCAWGNTNEPRVFRVGPDAGTRQPILSAVTAPSCLAVSSSAPTSGAWLLIGGGALPGQYPRSSVSELLRFDGAAFQSGWVTNLGMVTAATFADLDADGGRELITVSEGGTPQIFRGHDATFEGWDAPLHFGPTTSGRLSDLTGWWQSLAVGDFDRDGYPDLVLGNWGLNSAYALYTGGPQRTNGSLRPLALYFGAALQADSGACIEAYTGADGQWRPIHSLVELGPHLPWLTARFPTYRRFAEATIGEILAEKNPAVERLQARWLSSLLLLRRGDHFEVRPLPDSAQLGPLTALVQADFDGDGKLDLFAAQGFFGHNFGVTRDDAGEGVFLLGRGDGTFDAISAADAGVRLLGEQRAAVAVELGGDRRPDLIVGEYGGPITFLKNRSPRPGSP